MSDNKNGTVAKGMAFARKLIYILAICLAAVVLYRYYFGTTSSTKKEAEEVGVLPSEYTTVPKEYTIKYVPADFRPTIDSENALAILSNPLRYRREFNELVYNFNTSLLDHVANRMGLDMDVKAKIKTEYDKQHPAIRTMYFNDFTALQDTSSTLYQTWYNNESKNAVDLMNEVASKYTCFIMTNILGTVLETYNGKFAAKGARVENPCGIAMTEGLRPMIDRLQDKAAIMDFSRSKGLMEEKVERVIAELATFEVRDKKGLNKQLQTKVLGYSVSSSDIEVSAISILKVGFKLEQYFDISLNPKNNTVTVTLPEPEILSHEVYPKIDKLDIGWMREVKSVDLNENFNALRTEFRREAIQGNAMEKAKGQAMELMNTMFTPMVENMSKKYRLQVKFRQGQTQTVDDLADLEAVNG